MVCYAGKQETPFWFSLLDQIVQFGAIIFCRTFKNYFGQFVWIEKKKSHYNSRVSLHEAPTKSKRIGNKNIQSFRSQFQTASIVCRTSKPKSLHWNFGGTPQVRLVRSLMTGPTTRTWLPLGPEAENKTKIHEKKWKYRKQKHSKLPDTVPNCKHSLQKLKTEIILPQSLEALCFSCLLYRFPFHMESQGII